MTNSNYLGYFCSIFFNYGVVIRLTSYQPGMIKWLLYVP